MSRWKAACIHFAISISAIAAVTALLTTTWFPASLLQATGGLRLIGIFAGVNICLGPLLTLIVFKPEKPGLKFDLACIAVIQLLAMGYGLYIMYLARPVYMVFTVDRFELVSASEISPENLQKARRDEFRSLPLTGPEIIAAQKPESEQEREQLLFSAFAGGADLQHLPQYYAPYAAMTDAAVRKAMPLDNLLQRDAQTRAMLTAYLAEHELRQDNLKFLPLRARVKDQTVLIEAVSGKVLGFINIDPW